jgi:hypothetical protein
MLHRSHRTIVTKCFQRKRDMQRTMVEPNELPNRQTSERWRRFRRAASDANDCVVTSSPVAPSSSPRQTLIDEAIRDGILQRRPEQISLVVHRESVSDSLGISFCSAAETKQDSSAPGEGDSKHVILVDDIRMDSLFSVANPNAEQDDPLRSEALLQPGDVLESINHTQFSTIPQVESYLQSLVGVIIITVSTLQKSHIDTSTGLCQLVICKPNNRMIYKEPSGLDFCQNQQGLLQVKRVPTDGLFSGINVIQTGEMVLAIGSNMCVTLDARDAQFYLDCKLETSDMVSILTQSCSKRQQRWNSVRKSAVAVGGGTMTAVGAVMMVTPLHPIGHALAIGGVAVLGTEFDAPKKALESARGLASNAISKRKRLSQLDQDTAESDDGHESNSNSK